jgi:hypothetical protein
VNGVAIQSLDDGRRASFRRKGILLTIVGLLLFLAPVAIILTVFSGFFSDPLGTVQRAFWAIGLGFLLSAVGIICIVIGGRYLSFGFMQAAAEIAATETGGALEYGTAAAGRGLGQGLKQSGIVGGSGTVQVVKLKCRSCGFLGAEDAAYCSKCGKAM